MNYFRSHCLFHTMSVPTVCFNERLGKLVQLIFSPVFLKINLVSSHAARSFIAHIKIMFQPYANKSLSPPSHCQCKQQATTPRKPLLITSFLNFLFQFFFFIHSPEQDIVKFLNSVKVIALLDSKYFPKPWYFLTSHNFKLQYKLFSQLKAS